MTSLASAYARLNLDGKATAERTREEPLEDELSDLEEPQEPKERAYEERSKANSEASPPRTAEATLTMKDLRENACAVAEGIIALVDVDGSLDPKGEGLEIQLLRYPDFLYELRVVDPQRCVSLMTQPVSQNMQLIFKRDEDAMTWLSYHEAVLAWRFDFSSSEQCLAFKTAMAQALVEQARKESFSKLFDARDERWLLSAYEEEEPKPEMEGDPVDEEEFGFEDKPHVEASNVAWNEKDYNSNLNVGMAQNRDYVFRGPSLGIFKHNSAEEMEFVGKLDRIEGLDQTDYAPATTLLHERDTKMLLLHPGRPDAIAEMDIEAGKVVNEWRAKEFKIRDIAPVHKYAQLESTQCFAAVSHNGLYIMDPRVGGGDKMVGAKINQRGKYSCLATTGQGHVVVGSQNGDIRLFSSLHSGRGSSFQRAKTQLPGLGDPITGIDVTQDGKWVLATTPRYLLLVATTIIGDEDTTGFEVKTPFDKRKAPLKLSLRYEDLMKFNIQEVSFTPATFNTGKDSQEHWIVTSTGPYIITWDLRRVQQGHKDAYQIKRTSSTVVQSKFRYNKEDQVVVNLPNDVYLERRNRVGAGPSASPLR